MDKKEKLCAICKAPMPRKSNEELGELGWCGMSGTRDHIKFDFVFCPKHSDPKTVVTYFNNWWAETAKAASAAVLDVKKGAMSGTAGQATTPPRPPDQDILGR